MFRRTHIRLTIINSLVFMIVIATLGFVIYSYTAENLYRETNKAIQETATRFKARETENKRPFERHEEREMRGGFQKGIDPRLGIIRWSKDTAVYETPNSFLFEEHEKDIKPKQLDVLYDIEINGFSYRTYAIQGNGGDMIQILRNVNSEKEILNHLLLIMTVGCGIGLLASFVAGYFLAGRALVPIQKSWEKQQQFVSDASHELRTPLAVIQSKADVLFRHPTATIQERAIDISVIGKECRRLVKLVGNLLLLARSDSNEIAMEKKTFSMTNVMEELLAHYEEIALYQEKTLQLIVTPKLMFHGDAERIHQLLVILVDNALKYTEAGGSIQLSGEQTTNSLIIRIQDNGIGIPSQNLDRIFDRFYQGDEARTMSEGAGLGLSIAKWIVEQHHGKIKVYSELGKGTTFEIIMPKHQR